MRLIIGILTVLAVLLGVFVFINLSGNTLTSFFSRSAHATIDGHSFTLLQAKSENDKQIGLSGRTSIQEDQGMIFLFDKPEYYGFWMKNMKFPIDIIFLKDKKIVTIFTNVPNPKSPTDQLPIYSPNQPADTVIELHAGTASKYNFQTGDSVTISL